MAFNINNSSKFSLDIQPKNITGQTQLTIDSSIIAGAAISSLAKGLIDKLVKNDDELNSESISALENRFISKAFEELYIRGINPLRPEIILASEFVPIATGEVDNNSESPSINLNYGEGSNLKVNQVMRLIDLQRIIRKNILKVAGDFLEEYINVPNDIQQSIILHMHNVLKENIQEFLKIGSDTEALVGFLVELSSKQGLAKNFKIGPFLKKTNIEFSKNKNSLKEKTTQNRSNSTDNTTESIKLPINLIKNLNSSDRSGFLEAIARYVIFDYVMQNTISFVTRIHELKNLLRESISIAHTELPAAEVHDTLDNPSTSENIPMFFIAPSLLTSFINKDERIKSANLLLKSWGMQSSTGPDGFSGSQKHDLSKVINADTQGNNEEVFGSNRHMYANLFSNLLKSMTFVQSLEEEESKAINKNTVAFSNGSKNLAKGIKILKSITPKSMSSSMSGLDWASPGPNKLDGNKINSLLTSVSDDPDTTLTELMSAVCYDQITGVNSIAGADKLISPALFDNFQKLDSIDNILIQFFNRVFFDTGVTSWSQLADNGLDSFNYSDIAKHDSKLGAYLRSRFEPRNDEGTLYIPNEHSYEDNTHREDSFLISPDYFFNKALSSESLKFEELKKEVVKIENEVDAITHDISSMMGLDFDMSGNPEYDINGFSAESNPLQYFNSLCKVLGAEARETSNNLKGGVDLAVPLIEAGSFSDKTFVANVIKASFLNNVSNESNIDLALNLNTYDDGSFIESALKKNLIETVKEEISSFFSAEADYLIEEKVWYKLFSSKLKNLLRGKSESKLRVREEKFPLNKSKTYKAVLANDSDGTADWNNSTEKKGDETVSTWEGKNFGINGRKDQHHPDYEEHRYGTLGSDDHFEKTLNFEDEIDKWKIIVAIATTAVFVIFSGGIGALGFLSSTSGGLAAALTSIGSMFTGFTTAVGSAVTAGGILGSILVYTTVITSVTTLTLWGIDASKRSSKERPRGVGFSKSGYFESVMLRNAILLPPSARPKSVEEAQEEDFIINATKTLFGAAPNENFLLKSKPGNGSVKQWESLAGLVDKLAELGSTIGDFIGLDGSFGIDGENEGTVAEEDIYQPWFYKWNENAGNYGGIFKTNTASRYTLFTLFFSRIMHKSLCVRYVAGDKKLVIKYYPTPWIGMADALEGQSKRSSYQANGEYESLKEIYDVAYDRTKKMMDNVKKTMLYRRAAILKNLAYLKQNITEIKEAVNRSESILNGASSEIPAGEKMALAFLKKTGFVKNGFVFLNDNTAGTLLQNYQKNYILDFRSDENEVANPEGISVYPFFNKESYDIRELKLMAKIYSEKNRGITSSVKDDLGRKTMLHIGIPMGLLSALRNEAYQKTGEIEYYYSDNIAIHITKKNDLNPSLKYQARTYVFNMSKYVASTKSSDSYKDILKPGSLKLANHLESYSDTWSLEDVKNNVEILTANRSSPYYEKGLEGIKLINEEQKDLIYADDIYTAMLENHLYDYYGKLYTEVTTGIDMSETLFPLNRLDVFDGQVDKQSEVEYENLVNELTNRYPASNIIPGVAHEFYRTLKSIRSSLYFSSESRYKSCISTQCFQRIFSIPLSERDFLLKQSDYNLVSSDLYSPQTAPRITLSSESTGVSQNAVINITGQRQNDIFKMSPATTILEYTKILNPKKTDISSFLVEIAILKSSKLD